MTTDDLPTRLWRIANDYYVLVSGAVGGAGLIMIWQDIGPSIAGTALLLVGIGWYAYQTTGEGNDNDPPKADRDSVQEIFEEGVESDEDESAEDDSEAEDDGDDESILDKLARVIGGDGDESKDEEREPLGFDQPLEKEGQFGETELEADLDLDLEEELDFGTLEEGDR